MTSILLTYWFFCFGDTQANNSMAQSNSVDVILFSNEWTKTSLAMNSVFLWISGQEGLNDTISKHSAFFCITQYIANFQSCSQNFVAWWLCSVSLCSLWKILITLWIGYMTLSSHASRHDYSVYSLNNICCNSFIFDFRWFNIGMTSQLLFWPSDGSTVLLTTYRSLWIILVAVCTLIPEKPLKWSWASVTIHFCIISFGHVSWHYVPYVCKNFPVHEN